MTLRMDSLRIDAVPVTFHGERVVAVEQRRQSRNLLEPIISLSVPRIAHGDDGRGSPCPEFGHQCRLQGDDPWVRLIVEEVEVVEEAGGLPHAEAQEGVEA